MSEIVECACGCGKTFNRFDERGRERAYAVGHGRHRPLRERFWEKVDKPGDCWMWTGCVDGSGYGQIRHNNRMRGAHRVSWKLAHGAIPDGMFVCHHCDTPGCVRPEHLFLGTPTDNVCDARDKERLVIHSGPDHPMSKLSILEAKQARKLYAEGELEQSQIADRFGVAEPTIGHILTGRTYQSISDGLQDRIDRISSRRQARPNAILNPVAVRVLRWMYEHTDVSQSRLARAHGVSPATVADVVHGRRWAWVD